MKSEWHWHGKRAGRMTPVTRDKSEAYVILNCRKTAV